MCKIESAQISCPPCALKSAAKIGIISDTSKLYLIFLPPDIWGHFSAVMGAKV